MSARRKREHPTAGSSLPKQAAGMRICCMVPIGAVLAAAACVLATVFATTGLAGSAWAQGASAKAATPQAAISEPETLEAVREILSELDDTQVRAVLLERMTKEVERRAAERAAQQTISFGELARDYGRALGRYTADAVAKLADIPGGITAAGANFMDERGPRGFAWFLASLLACLAAGAAATFAGHRVAAQITAGRATTAGGTSFAAQVQAALVSALALLAPVVTFVAGAGGANLLLNGSFPVDYQVTGRLISAFAWTAVAVAVARFALSPTVAEWRRCPIASGTADFLVWRIGWAAALFNFGIGFMQWLDRFGSPFEDTRLGFWLNLALHILLLATLWQARRGIRAIAAGSAQIAESGGAPWAAQWPSILIVLIAGHWLVANIFAATANMPEHLFTAMPVTLAIMAGLPLFDHAIRAGVRNALPMSADASAALRAAEQATRAGLVRIARVAAAVLVLLAVVWLWGLDAVALAQKGMGERLGGSLVNVLLIAGLAYGLWETVRIVTERQIAIERSTLGLDQQVEGEAVAEGEGGGAGARLGTILPLVRIALQIAITVLAVLAILGELGINVLPILAGAGVVGLAIGFGAQTLVKDIISGIFFLVDDAFRKGEYIDIGSVKGTVEKISLRSMQLRHHNGPLNTIPFGDIRHVTNFSRDWVIMKLSLRLTYDTDAEKVRKLIKKLGQEMAEEPNLKPLFLQPLKSQGVIEMQDSAQIMRVKFMTRPGDQWGLRRVVFARIRELFEREGIRFASREVVVRVEHASGGHDLTPEDRAAIGASAARALDLEDAAAGRPHSP